MTTITELQHQLNATENTRQERDFLIQRTINSREATAADIAHEIGVSESTISRIARKDTESQLTYRRTLSMRTFSHSRTVVVEWRPQLAAGADPARDNLGKTLALWNSEADCPIELHANDGTGTISIRELINSNMGDGQAWSASEDPELSEDGTWRLLEDEDD